MIFRVSMGIDGGLSHTHTAYITSTSEQEAQRIADKLAEEHELGLCEPVQEIEFISNLAEGWKYSIVQEPCLIYGSNKE